MVFDGFYLPGGSNIEPKWLQNRSWRPLGALGRPKSEPRAPQEGQEAPKSRQESAKSGPKFVFSKFTPKNKSATARRRRNPDRFPPSDSPFRG